MFDIIDNSIYIVPNALKLKILEEEEKTNGIYNITFYTLEEVEKHYFFEIKDETLLYLLEKTNENIDILRLMLNNLYNINPNENYKDTKLINLKNLYNDLKNNNYLVFDKGFNDYLKTKNIYYLGYPLLDQYQKDMLDKINAKKINIDSTLNIDCVYKYNTLKDEVISTALRIRELNSKGVPYKKIIISGIDDSYYYVIKDIFRMFDIPLNIKNTSKFNSLISIKEYLNTKDINVVRDINLKSKIIKVLEELDYAKNSKYYDLLLKDKINSLSIDTPNMMDAVRVDNNIIDIPYLVSDDEYAFILGFNQNYIPKIYKDEDYLSDNLKLKCGINTSFNKNKLSKDNLIEVLGTIKNITISYKLTSLTNEYAKSSILNELNIKEKEEIIYKYNFSDKFNKYRSSVVLDNYYKYHEKMDDFDYLITNIDTSRYTSYNNKFNGIKRDITPYSLSYSSIDDLAKCPFKYYLKHILKLDSFEDSFNTKIGNIFHSVLKDSYNDGFNYSLTLNKALNDNNFDSRESLLFERVEKELRYIINNNKKMEKRSFFDKFYGEKKITIELNDNATLKGFIDKILYKEFHDKTYYAVFDYKTGSATLNLDYIEDGLYLQLPLYIYLIEKSKLFKNSTFVGFFYQFLLNKYKDDMERSKNLKLFGYTTNDKTILSYLDEEYADNSFVRGLSLTKDGKLHSRSKVLSDEELDNLLIKIDKTLDKSLKIIESNDFQIAPKVINNKNISCEYCPFKEICFVSFNDYIYLKKEGDDNA